MSAFDDFEHFSQLWTRTGAVAEPNAPRVGQKTPHAASEKEITRCGLIDSLPRQETKEVREDRHRVSPGRFRSRSRSCLAISAHQLNEFTAATASVESSVMGAPKASAQLLTPVSARPERTLVRSGSVDTLLTPVRLAQSGEELVVDECSSSEEALIP